MKILIVDGSLPVIQRLEEMIPETARPLVIDKAVSFNDANRLFEKVKHDMVLLDLGLPGGQSFDLIWDSKKLNPSTTIIVFSIHADDATQDHCFDLGADFFLDKNNDFDKIPGIINKLTATGLKNS